MQDIKSLLKESLINKNILKEKEELKTKLGNALLKRPGHSYENLRAHIVETYGYDFFRDLQKEAFKNILTNK